MSHDQCSTHTRSALQNEIAFGHFNETGRCYTKSSGIEATTCRRERRQKANPSNPSCQAESVPQPSTTSSSSERWCVRPRTPSPAFESRARKRWAMPQTDVVYAYCSRGCRIFKLDFLGRQWSCSLRRQCDACSFFDRGPRHHGSSFGMGLC